MVPDIYRTSKGVEVSSPFAFISVEDTGKLASEPKALCGQMRVYDLTKGRQVGGLLAEVRSFIINLCHSISVNFHIINLGL